MERIHPPQLLDQDGTSELSAPQIVAVSTENGQPVSPEMATRIANWATGLNGTATAQLIATQQQQRLVNQLFGLMGRLGDKWELEDLDKMLPDFRLLDKELQGTPGYKHLRANGTLAPTWETVWEARPPEGGKPTRESRVQFVWSSLLVGFSNGTSLADLYATALLWVPFLLIASATKDDE